MKVTQPKFTRIVLDFLSEDDWPVLPATTDKVVCTAYRGKNGPFLCYAYCNDELAVAVYSVCPIDISEERKCVIEELLTRINLTLFLGNFEMDMDKRRITCKHSILVRGFELSVPILRPIFMGNVQLMDHYLPVIRNVAYSAISPLEALKRVN